MMLRVAKWLIGLTALFAVVALASALLGRPLQASLALPGLAQSASVGFEVGVLQGVLLCLIAGVGTVVAWYSSRNLVGQRRQTRYALGEIGLVLSLGIAVTTTSLLLLALAWTSATSAISALVGHSATPSATVAQRQVRARLLVGDALLWASVIVIGTQLGAWSLGELPVAVAQGSSSAVTAAALLLVGAGIVRSALVPAHRWLPETAEAPSPVSALLHAGVVNGAGVLALLMWPLLVVSAPARVLLVVLGAVTAVVATAQMRARADVKGRLASSTSSQMGYLAIQVGIGIPAAALAHVVGHGVWKAAQFLGAGDAVARIRRSDRSGGSRVTPVGIAVCGLLAVAAVGVAASVTIGDWPTLLAPAELLPVGVAIGVGWCALVAIARAPLARSAATMAGGVVLIGAATYIVGLRAFTHALAGQLGLPAGWSSPDAGVTAAAVIALLVLGFVLVLVDARARSGRLPRLARWAGHAALRPRTVHERWSRRPRVGVALPPVTAVDAGSVSADVAAASMKLARLYPLTSFVASNPLADLEDVGFRSATTTAAQTWGVHTGPSASVIRQALAAGQVSGTDIDAAVAAFLSNHSGDPGLVAPLRPDAVARELLLADEPANADTATVMEALRRAGIRTQRRVHTPMEAANVPAAVQGRARDLGHLCCARSLGSPAWPGAMGPWSQLRDDTDSLDGLLGVRGAGAIVAALPDDPGAAVAALLEHLGVEPHDRPALLARLLARDPGWPGHLLWRERHALLGLQAGLPAEAGPSPSGLLMELTATRLALEVIVAEAHAQADGHWVQALDLVSVEPSHDIARLLASLTSTDDDLSRTSVDELQALVDMVSPFADGGLADLRLQVLERGYRVRLFSDMAGAHEGARGRADDRTDGSTVAAQVVTCIDVRSERLRRHLESRGAWETFGAAGFFGIPVRHESADGLMSERAPALMRPAILATEDATSGGARRGWLDGLARAIGSVERTPGLVFGWAEAFGWLLALPVLARTWWPARIHAVAAGARRRAGARQSTRLRLHADTAELAAAAEGFLRTTGLMEFAPVVVLCGHGATVTNNPHVAAYDCGACGGAAGDVSARAMAEVLNDPDVRESLKGSGIAIPDDTVFVAALHDTTTDVVRVLDDGAGSGADAHVLADLLAALSSAGGAVREERLPLLPDASPTPSAKASLRAAITRGRDWAQPRPEWGLAGAAAIVVGPRSLTRGVNLDGRVFLQSYRADLDPDGSALEQLMVAPVVVAQWITAQYWASVVDPHRFGAGDKTTHNVIGSGEPLTGVMAGARGDLRIGLPWQAVSAQAPTVTAGDPWTGPIRHLPQRLLVVVHARAEVIDRILDRQASIRRLVDGDWLTLCAVDPTDGSVHRRRAGGGWTFSRELGQSSSTTEFPPIRLAEYMAASAR